MTTSLSRAAAALVLAGALARAGAAEPPRARPAASGASPFAQRPESPPLDPAFRGVVLSAPARSAPGMAVHGALQVPELDFAPGAKVLDAVAVVVTVLPVNGPYAGGGTGRFVWMPFRSRKIGKGDLRREGGLVRAWFTVPLPRELAQLDRPFYVVASAGPHASKVVTVQPR